MDWFHSILGSQGCSFGEEKMMERVLREDFLVLLDQVRVSENRSVSFFVGLVWDTV